MSDLVFAAIYADRTTKQQVRRRSSGYGYNEKKRIAGGESCRTYRSDHDESLSSEPAEPDEQDPAPLDQSLDLYNSMGQKLLETHESTCCKEKSGVAVCFGYRVESADKAYDSPDGEVIRIRGGRR